jgi:hypothetical protein
VSTTPNGGDTAVLDTTVNATVIGPTVLEAPVSASVIAPVTLPDAGNVASNFTARLSAADPDPDAGVTLNQGLFDDAVHVTAAPAPCVRRTVWLLVWLVKAVHMVAAARFVRADWESFWASLTFEHP